MSKNQMNEQAQITYTYMHCDKSDFAHEINFNEEVFNSELTKVFETSIPIERATVEFIMEDRQAGGRFTVVVRLQSPMIKFEHTEESYDNHARAVTQAIRKAVEYVRMEKEKLTHK